MKNSHIQQAVQWLEQADGLLITAGAGMGVDSGLPDFRGSDGFWRAYPALRGHGLSFEAIADPSNFVRHPRLAWGFYGHRLALYRATVPHAGFDILHKWANTFRQGAFVFTSNVDGQFQKAGFAAERIMECHGAIHTLQCVNACTEALWSADAFLPQVDTGNCLLTNDLPLCPHCGALARPNILMFGDYHWIDRHAEAQARRLENWLVRVRQPVVIELGAGKALPTVRRFSERHGPQLIRINPRESAINPNYGIGIAGNALEVLQQIDEARLTA